jgi:hypothetical protein
LTVTCSASTASSEPYFKGQEKEIVPLERKLKFAPLSVQSGYQKWEDGKIVDERFADWASGEKPVLRNDLGDHPKDENAKDPWSYALRCAFRLMSGPQLKFVTGSTGGVNAIRKLLRTWKQERDNHPDLVPVIELGTESYVHKEHRTEIITPTFTIVDWAPWDREKPKAVAGPKADADDSRTISHDLDDEIPF